MKRFYCTVCNRVKRVQKWPADVQAYTSVNVMDRMGTCNWHTVGNRTPVQHRNTYARVVKSVTGKAPISKRRKAS